MARVQTLIILSLILSNEVAPCFLLRYLGITPYLSPKSPHHANLTIRLIAKNCATVATDHTSIDTFNPLRFNYNDRRGKPIDSSAARGTFAKHPRAIRGRFTLPFTRRSPSKTMYIAKSERDTRSRKRNGPEPRRRLSAD